MFERSCLYHATEKMRVIEADNEQEYKRLLETGAWFDHPNKATKKEINNEKPIRRNVKQGLINGKKPSSENGS